MAKRVSKNIKSECCAPAAVGDYKPSLYLDLEGKSVKELEGIQLGEEVQVLVKGKVTRLEQRKSMRYRKDKEVEVETGSISIEGYEVAVVEDEKNEFTKLAEDDE